MSILDPSTPERDDRWRATPALVRSLGVPMAAVLVALLARRPDLIVLVSPIVVVLAWSLATRPTALPTRSVRLSHSQVREGEQSLVVADVSPAEHVDVIATAVSSSLFVEMVNRQASAVADPVPTMDAAAAAAAEKTSADATPAPSPGRTRLLVGVRPLRWGPRRVGPVQVGAASPWGAFRWGPVTTGVPTLRVLPQPSAFDSSAPAPHPRGLVGHHRSARPGEGTEFRSLRPFQVGDRLRRIHWPRSSRTGELHVTSTYSDEDTHVAVLVDAHYDIGVSEGLGREASSLDRSVRAAAAVAEHFLRQGDRVSLRVMSSRTPMTVRPGTGMRHGQRVLDTLSRIVPGVPEQTDPRRVTEGIRGGTLVVMVSALVSPDAVSEAAMLAGRGISVVVIDTLAEATRGRSADALPEPPAGTSATDALATTAWRLRLLERDREVRAVQARGVAVVPWLGPGSLDVVLQQLARRGRGGRST